MLSIPFVLGTPEEFCLDAARLMLQRSSRSPFAVCSVSRPFEWTQHMLLLLAELCPGVQGCLSDTGM